MTEVAASSPNKWMIFAEAIKWFQGTNYSHVLIVKDGMVYQSTHLGVNKMGIEEFLKDNNIVWHMQIQDSLLDWEYIEEALEKHIGYGYMQVFAIAVRRFLKIIIREKSSKHLVCSEFVGHALRLDWVDDFTDPEQIVDYLIKAKI